MILLNIILVFVGRSDTIVNKVYIKGNKRIKDSEIRKILFLKKKAKMTKQALESDSIRIINLYREEGFLDTEVSYSYEIKFGNTIPVIKFIPFIRRYFPGYYTEITYNIKEGKRLNITRIEILGANYNNIVRLLTFKRPGPYRKQSLDETRQKIETWYKNHGFPQAVLSYSADTVGYHIYLKIKISKGREKWIKNIFFLTLNDTIRSGAYYNFLLNTLYIRKGQLYSRLNINKSRMALLGTYIFKEVIPLNVEKIEQNENDSVNIDFFIKEDKPRAVTGEVGIELMNIVFVKLGLNYYNIFRRGIKAGGEGFFEYSPNLKSIETELHIIYPYITGNLFKNSDLLVKPFFYYSIFYGLNNYFYGGKAEFLYKPFQIKSITFYTLTQLNAYSIELATVSPLFTGENVYRSNMLVVFQRTGLRWDNRDNPFDAKQGLYSGSYFDIGKAGAEKSQNFVRIRWEQRYYFALNRNNILALRFVLGYITPEMNREVISTYEEFFVGGVSSLRGLREKGAGPDSIIVDSRNRIFEYYTPILINFNTEMRIGKWKNFGFVFFHDGAFVGRSKNDLRFVGSYGIGFRYYTPIGPIRLDWGRLFNANNDDLGRIYVGFFQGF